MRSIYSFDRISLLDDALVAPADEEPAPGAEDGLLDDDLPVAVDA